MLGEFNHLYANDVKKTLVGSRYFVLGPGHKLKHQGPFLSPPPLLAYHQRLLLTDALVTLDLSLSSVLMPLAAQHGVFTFRQILFCFCTKLSMAHSLFTFCKLQNAV